MIEAVTIWLQGYQDRRLDAFQDEDVVAVVPIPGARAEAEALAEGEVHAAAAFLPAEPTAPAPALLQSPGVQSHQVTGTKRDRVEHIFTPRLENQSSVDWMLAGVEAHFARNVAGKSGTQDQTKALPCSTVLAGASDTASTPFPSPFRIPASPARHLPVSNASVSPIPTLPPCNIHLASAMGEARVCPQSLTKAQCLSDSPDRCVCVLL